MKDIFKIVNSLIYKYDILIFIFVLYCVLIKNLIVFRQNKNCIYYKFFFVFVDDFFFFGWFKYISEFCMILVVECIIIEE